MTNTTTVIATIKALTVNSDKLPIWKLKEATGITDAEIHSLRKAGLVELHKLQETHKFTAAQRALGTPSIMPDSPMFQYVKLV